jgi:molybdate/tungstate transport system ATP-binding protein
MIKLENIAWSAGTFRLESLSLEVPANRYAVLMGRTGSGKTSLIEILCGLRQLTNGKVWVAGREVTYAAPGERGIGYVPQDGALFPTMTVREQLAFAPRLQKRAAKEIESLVKKLADELGIAALLDRLPTGLSGGERQRVALGRALAAKPQVLLLDEPLSALDEEMRDEVAQLLKRVQREHQLTALHITHSSREAQQLADVVFRLENGRVTEAKLDTLH